jgi:hypothetical protein
LWVVWRDISHWWNGSYRYGYGWTINWAWILDLLTYNANIRLDGAWAKSMHPRSPGI